MELSVTKILWDLFSLLCQGAVAGLIVLLVSNYLQAKQDSSLCKKHALLVSLEVQSHIAMLEDMLQHEQIPISVVPIVLESNTWNNSKQFLTRLPISDLEKIGSYYQSISAINHLLVSYSGKPLTPILYTSFTPAHLMSKITYHLLAAHWDIKNVQKHSSLLEKLRQQAAAYHQKNL